MTINEKEKKYIELTYGITLDELCQMTKDEQHKLSLENFGKKMTYKKEENGEYSVYKDEKTKKFIFKRK